MSRREMVREIERGRFVPTSFEKLKKSKIADPEKRNKYPKFLASEIERYLKESYRGINEVEIIYID